LSGDWLDEAPCLPTAALARLGRITLPANRWEPTCKFEEFQQILEAAPGDLLTILTLRPAFLAPQNEIAKPPSPAVASLDWEDALQRAQEAANSEPPMAGLLMLPGPHSLRVATPIRQPETRPERSAGSPNRPQPSKPLGGDGIASLAGTLRGGFKTYVGRPGPLVPVAEQGTESFRPGGKETILLPRFPGSVSPDESLTPKPADPEPLEPAVETVSGTGETQGESAAIPLPFLDDASEAAAFDNLLTALAREFTGTSKDVRGTAMPRTAMQETAMNVTAPEASPAAVNPPRLPRASQKAIRLTPMHQPAHPRRTEPAPMLGLSLAAARNLLRVPFMPVWATVACPLNAGQASSIRLEIGAAPLEPAGDPISVVTRNVVWRTCAIEEWGGIGEIEEIFSRNHSPSQSPRAVLEETETDDIYSRRQTGVAWERLDLRPRREPEAGVPNPIPAFFFAFDPLEMAASPVLDPVGCVF
jgi:hypothetical protein